MKFKLIEKDRLKCLECNKTFSKNRRKHHLMMWHPKGLPENIFETGNKKLVCKLCNKVISRQSWYEHNDFIHPDLSQKRNLERFLEI